MPASPGQHVVVTVKENHGFDNYFGTFVGAKGMALPCSSNPPSTNPTAATAHGLRATRQPSGLSLSNRIFRIFIGEGSLRRSMRDFDWHYHLQRNHQGIGNDCSRRSPHPWGPGAEVRPRQRLGGMLRYLVD